MSLTTLLVTVGIGALVFLLVIGGMALGVLFGRRPISGSCGGLANRKDADGNTSCSLCSNPDEACRELNQRQRMESHPGEPVENR